MTEAQEALQLYCASCVFFAPGRHPPGYLGRLPPRGQCRRHAPQLDRDGDGLLRAAWPLVAERSFCGEHSTLEMELADERPIGGAG